MRKNWRRRLGVEQLEPRALLATVAFHWTPDEVTGAESVVVQAKALAQPMALGGDTAALANTEVVARYAVVAEAARVEAVYGPLPLAVATAVAENESRALAIYAAGAVADQFLQQHAAALGVQDVAADLVPHQVQSDSLGMTHLRFEQQYQGVPVFGSELLVHLDSDQQVASANGRLVSEIRLDATPQVSQDQAVALAKQYFADEFGTVGQASSLWDMQAGQDGELNPEMTDRLEAYPTSTLYVFNAGLLENRDEPVSHLVWHVRLYQEDLAADESFYVDAHTGELVHQMSETRELYRKVYDCSAYPSLKNCYVDQYSPTYNYTWGRSEGEPPKGPNHPKHPGTTDVDDMYDMLAQLDEFYRVTFGRDGGNGLGGLGDGIKAPLTETWGRVYWDDVFGVYCPGASFEGRINAATGWVVPDVMGHEYSHAIPYFLSRNPNGTWNTMPYQGEQGALQENYADVIGVLFEDYSTGSMDWRMGETSPVGAARDFAAPESLVSWRTAAPSPVRYRDPGFYLGTDDFGGVHENATIPSNAFYLISEGGSFNGYQINVLGIDKASQIWYRAVTTYYTTTETFNDAYYDIIQAAEDLYGEEDADEVRKAMQAVEMNLPPAARVDQVTVSSPTVTTFSVSFTNDMDIAGMLAEPGGDGSIVSAVSVVNRDSDAATPLDASQFSYDAATKMLTWTGTTPLPEGTYELRLRTDLLKDGQGEAIWGTTTGLVFSPVLGGLQNIQSAGADLAVDGWSAPTLADWNSDGLTDLLVGERTADGLGKLRVYLNTGTAESPQFDAFFYAQAGGTDLTVPGGDGFGLSARLSDWDGDGLQDLVTGLANGSVLFWPNTNTAAEPQFSAPVGLEAGEPGEKTPIDVGDQAMVEMTDWNNDGRLDLVVGGLDGRISLYLNDGNGGTPELRTPIAVQNGTLDLIVPNGQSAPAVTDLNGDGRKDLVVGYGDGTLLLYANHGTDAEPEFNTTQLLGQRGTKAHVAATPRSCVSVGDWNGDGLTDVLLGAEDGLVRLALATSSPTSATTEDRVLGSQGAVHVHTFYADGPAAFPPTVTISQAAGQADPTNQSTVHFAVEFSKPVVDFDASDVTLGGTAGATTVQVTTTDQTLFDVAVSGMAQDGTVTIAAAAGAAHDADGAASAEPTIVDNSVTYDSTPPAVTIALAAGQADPTNQSPVNFAVTFSEPVSGLTADDVTLGGSAGPTIVEVTGEGSTYNIAVSGMTSRGTVAIEIAAGVAADAAGNGNTPSAGSMDVLLYNGWHNFDLPSDVDGNGRVEPVDVLQTINYINSHPGETSLPPPPEGPHLYYDVTDNGACAPVDVLTVINWINSHPQGAGEGEAESSNAVLDLAHLPILATGFWLPPALWDANRGRILVATPSSGEPLAVALQDRGWAPTWSPRVTARPARDELALRNRSPDWWPDFDVDFLNLHFVLTDLAAAFPTADVARASLLRRTLLGLDR